jgi:hypothetical protein
MWKSYTGRIEGIILQGDPKVPPTRWWNHLWLVLFVWNEVTILEVPPDAPPYRVGYAPYAGGQMYQTRLLHKPRFAVRHGHENCRFFAVTADGTELPLKIATRTTIEALPNSVPLV